MLSIGALKGYLIASLHRRVIKSYSQHTLQENIGHGHVSRNFVTLLLLKVELIQKSVGALS